MDDFSSDITTTGVIELGEVMNGSLETNTDSDWFAIDLIKGTTYSFDPTSFGPDIIWSVYDENGLKLGDIFPEISVEEAIETFSFVAGFTGRAFLGVSLPSNGYGSPQDYNFTLTSSTPSLESPDDFAADSTTEAVLTLDAVRFLTFQEHVGDSDWLQVTVESGQTIQFNGINFPGENFSLTVRDASGTALSDTVLSAAGDIQGAEQGAVEATLIHTFDAAGIYYLDLTGVTTNFTGTSVSAFDAQDDFAADITTIGQIISGGNIQGVIHRNDGVTPDEDWFRVDLVENQTLILSLDELPRAGQISVDFVDADGNVVHSETWRAPFIALDISQFIMTAPESGTYYARVTGTVPNFPYNIQTDFVTDDYHDSPGLFTDGVNDDAPFGELTTQSGPITGLFEHAFDSDAFQITLAPGEQIDVLLSLTSPFVGGSTAAAALQVFDPNGDLVGDPFTQNGNTSFAFGSDNGGTYTIVAGDLFLGDGEYRLEVVGQSDDHANTSENATPVTPGEISFGATEYDGDIDVFSFEAEAGDVIRLDAGWIGDSIGFLSTITDPDGNPVNLGFSIFNDQTQLFVAETTGTFNIAIEIDSVFVTERAPFAFLLDVIDDFPIPDSVEAIFGADYLSWAPVPQIDGIPTVTASEGLVLQDMDFVISANETRYITSDIGTEPIARVQGSSTFTNDGVIWIEDTTTPVFAIESYQGSHFINNGSFTAISRVSAEGLLSGPGDGGFFNSGCFTNTGDFTALSREDFSRGVLMSNFDDDVVFTNTGNFTVYSGQRDAEGVVVSTINGQVINTGDIQVTGYRLATGIRSDGFIVNQGNITSISGSLNSVGIESNVLNLDNSGIITADIAVYNMTEAEISNTGIITGDIILLGPDQIIEREDGGFVGENTLTNSGTINGDIGFGDFDDFYDARAGQTNGIVFFAGGNDIGFGGAEADFLFGEGGDDSLYGDAVRALSLESSEGELFRAYQAVFDRAPDAGGFNAFLTEMRLGQTTQEAVIEEFVTSAEFQNTYGDLSNRAFMEQLYRNVLDREGDEAGLNAFTGQLQAMNLTRAQVVVEFSNSAEFVQLMALPSAAFATNVIIDPAEVQVFRIYQAVFQRDPDEGGFTAFTNSIQAGTLTVDQITAEFVASQEFQNTYGDLDNVSFVDLLFTNVLPGNTDAQGRADFTESLDEGTLTREGMVAEFVETFEFVQRMSGPAVEFVSNAYTDSGDILVGGSGNDILFGGRGSDLFGYDTQDGGVDVILDFTSGTDSLALGDNADFDTLAEVMAAGTQAGQDTVFDFGGGNTLTLANVIMSELTESDFGFDAGADNSKASDAAAAVVTPFPLSEDEPESEFVDFELYDMFG